jgi:hypothetical protein
LDAFMHRAYGPLFISVRVPDASIVWTAAFMFITSLSVACPERGGQFRLRWLCMLPTGRIGRFSGA